MSEDARSDEGLRQVYATESQSDGYAAKGRLESEGIPVLIKGANSDAYPVGAMYLWVPQQLADKAEQILASGSAVDDAELEAEAMGSEPEGT
jgi:hypothetical protein